MIAWLNDLGTPVAIPVGAIIEIERGIKNIAEKNPERSKFLREWLNSILASNVRFLGMDLPTAQLYAHMTSLPALRNLWLPSSFAKNPKLGEDLSIAASAIVHKAPIATMNIRHFLQIHEHFKLPGLYNPMDAKWLVRPVWTDSVPFANRVQPTVAVSAVVFDHLAELNQ
nr:hypothetical protein [Mycoplana dimorpha]